MQQRRRTMMNDPIYTQKAQQMVEQPHMPTPGPEVYGSNYYEPVKRMARPVSWHPSTQLPQAQQAPSMPTQMSQYPFPNYCDYDFYAPPAMQVPPTPAAFSAYSSPGSAFSPLQLPSYTTYELPQTYASPCWNVSAAPMAPSVSSMNHAQQTLTFMDTMSCTPATMPEYIEPSFSPASLGNLPSSGYGQSMTAPPTPEDPPKAQQPAPVVVKQEPYSPPEEQLEEEEEGDILIGLGLYDPPERLGLLGASFQPTGKGLKLEDAWEPPVTDDDDDDDDEEAEDGEGDAESEEE